MKRLELLRNYHFGMGILIVGIQTIFQISNSIFLIGFLFIIFSFYEYLIVRKLKSQNGSNDILKTMMNQYKWISYFIVIPIGLITYMLIKDINTQEGLFEAISDDPTTWIFILIGGGLVSYFSTQYQINKIIQ